MSRIFFVFFLLVGFTNIAKSQTEIGFEIGHHESIYIHQPNGLANTYYSFQTGARLGFFLEREIKPSLGLRFNLFYDFRYFEIIPSDFLPFSHHTISLPIKAMFGSGKVVFGLGLNPMLLIPFKTSSNISSKSLFHIAPCAEIAFKVKKVMRFALYCNYDLIPIKYKNHGRFSNLVIGASFAVRIRKMKKRRVIYSPG